MGVNTPLDDHTRANHKHQVLPARKREFTSQGFADSPPQPASLMEQRPRSRRVNRGRALIPLSGHHSGKVLVIKRPVVASALDTNINRNGPSPRPRLHSTDAGGLFVDAPQPGLQPLPRTVIISPTVRGKGLRGKRWP